MVNGWFYIRGRILELQSSGFFKCRCEILFLVQIIQVTPLAIYFCLYGAISCIGMVLFFSLVECKYFHLLEEKAK